MKRSCLFALLFLMVTSLFAEHVDPETARKVATAFLNNNGLRTSQLTDLSKEAGFTNLYIFNGNPGFVVMSADDCVQPILGYSLEGTFVAENMPTNISGWLQEYDDEIQYGIDNQVKAATETAQLWKELANGNSKAGQATIVVDALVQTEWDQDPYYNQLCPLDNTANAQAVTGCVATAMAQVMKYWNFPSRGIGSHSYTPINRPEFGVQTADFGATTYDWTHMPNKLTASSSSTQKTAVATLMYHCGVSVEMMYNTAANNGSSAYPGDIPYALYNYFGYQMSHYYNKSDFTDLQWTSMLENELDNHRPVQYNGRGDVGGHAFVCDGYDSDGKYHFNWGWSGQNDGFYALTSLVPGSGGSGGAGYSFTEDQSACFGIQPSANTLAAPTDLDYTFEETNTVKLTWSSVSGASSFNVYRNSTLIGKASATTYYDYSAFYGTNEYYVRCVDANGQLSLASNRVNAFIAFPIPAVDDLTLTLSDNSTPGNVALSWTAPDWCYPEMPTATLTYGDGSFSGYTVGFGNASSHMYWGHRYPSNGLGSYNNLAIYKVSFYTTITGNFGVYVYNGTTSNHPETLVYSQNITASAAGWIDIDLTEIQLLDTSKDLWIFMYDIDGHEYPAAYSVYSGNYGNYCTSNPLSSVSTYSNAAFLIRTYLTDGVYTYRLYQDGVVVADNLSGTQYNATLGNNAPNLFHVTTHYYGGEAESNKVGHAKGNASIDDLVLGENDEITLTSGSVLTVTGTLKNSDPARLILEDGAQLIHNSTGVKATMKKGITPYSDNSNNDGWNFIASPVTEAVEPSTGNGLLNGTYDLYYYNEPTHYWMNYRANAFSFAPRQGYLYATDASNNTLQFAGTLTPSNTPVASNTLSWSAENLKGFNLIGNPFACNASLSSDFYVISGNHVVVAKTKRTIAPCEGVLVQATAANQTVTFSRADTQKGEDNALIDLVVTDGKTVLDRIRVRQGEGPGMEKFRLDGTETASLALNCDKQDYAVVHMNGQASWAVQFKTVKNGVYTLRVESNSLNPEYLHLIDHLTGADIDLLQNPSYSFEAQPNDYASRFKLVFNPSDPTGEIGDGFVEGKSVVIDMTGRVVATKANTQLAPGVYILRTVDGNETHSQKIIIK